MRCNIRFGGGAKHYRTRLSLFDARASIRKRCNGSVKQRLLVNHHFERLVVLVFYGLCGCEGIYGWLLLKLSSCDETLNGDDDVIVISVLDYRLCAEQ